MPRIQSPLALLLALAPIVAACDTAPTAPDALIPIEDATIPMDPELEISTDSELTALAVQGVEIALGNAAAGPRARIAAAREHFATARRRYQAGDQNGARTAGRQARQALSDAVLEGVGAAEVDLMIEEVDGVVATLSINSVGYDDAAGLSATLKALSDSAKTDRANGRDREAGEKAVRARQHRDRARKGPRDHGGSDGLLTRDVLARLQVAQGAEAEQLANSLITAPTVEQLRLLDTASELLDQAHAALAANELGRAASLAHQAEIKFLKAVIGTDLGHSDAQTILALSEQLLAQAREVVGAGGSAVDQAILELSARLFTGGSAKLAAGNARGLVLLWHSATMSSVLIG